MYTVEDACERLQVSRATLVEILHAFDWQSPIRGGEAVFHADQMQMLIKIKQGRDENGWSFIESAHRVGSEEFFGLDAVQFEDLARAISEAGYTLEDYHESFCVLCQEVSMGDTPKEAVRDCPPFKDEPSLFAISENLKNLNH